MTIPARVVDLLQWLILTLFAIGAGIVGDSILRRRAEKPPMPAAPPVPDSTADLILAARANADVLDDALPGNSRIAPLLRRLADALEADAAASERLGSALRLAHADLCEWRQFAAYNAAGLLCGEPVGLPDPPLRPTVAGLEQTERTIAAIRDAFAATKRTMPDPTDKPEGMTG